MTEKVYTNNYWFSPLEKKIDVRQLFSEKHHGYHSWIWVFGLLNIFATAPQLKPIYSYIDPFVSNAPFLYPLKILGNCKVFWCFQWVERGCIGIQWVNIFQVSGQFSISISPSEKTSENLWFGIKWVQFLYRKIPWNNSTIKPSSMPMVYLVFS